MLIEDEYASSDQFLTPARPARDQFLEQVERENEALERDLKAIGTPESQSRRTKASDKHYLNRIREEMDEFERQLHSSESFPGPETGSFKSTQRSMTPPHLRSQHSLADQSATNPKTLETRLRGANEAVRTLTKMLKDKERKVKELEVELERKEKTMQLMQSQSAVASGYQKSISVQSASASILKGRERELEIKVKSQEHKIQEDKKTLQRLQEVNKKLISKIKESDQRIQASAQKLNPAKVKRVSGLEDENQKLYLENRQLKEELQRLEMEMDREKLKFQELQQNAANFEAKTRDLYRANQLLNQNLVKIMNSQ